MSLLVKHQQIIDKFKSLKEMIPIITKLSSSLNDKTIKDDIIRLIHSSFEKYMHLSIDFIASYSDDNISDEEKHIISNEYDISLISSDIINTMDIIVNKISSYYSSPKLNILLQMYKGAAINCQPNIYVTNQCPDCLIDLISTNTIDYTCTQCGFVKSIDGTQIDNYTENTPVKNSNHKPSEHRRQWILQIFAQESTEIPLYIIDEIKNKMKRDGINNMTLSCKDIRKYLKNIKIKNNKKTIQGSKYYSNAPKIRYLITGTYPPQPTNNEFNDICSTCEIIDKIFLKIKDDNIISRRYYPHFICKAIEHVYKGQTQKINKIKEGIHFQDPITIDSNNKIWKQICEASNGQFT